MHVHIGYGSANSNFVRCMKVNRKAVCVQNGGSHFAHGGYEVAPYEGICALL